MQIDNLESSPSFFNHVEQKVESLGSKLKNTKKALLQICSIFNLQVRYCEEIGIPPIQSSKFYIYSGVTSMLIRPVIGRLCDMKRIHPCYFFQVAAAVTGTGTLLLPLARNNLHFVLYFILYGAADGTMNSAMTVAVMFCFTGEKRVQAFGLYRSVTNVASAVGPSLGGELSSNFVPRVLRFFGQRVVARRDSGIIEKNWNFLIGCYFTTSKSAVPDFVGKWRPYYPRVSPGDNPLTKEPEDSGPTIGCPLNASPQRRKLQSLNLLAKYR